MDLYELAGQAYAWFETAQRGDGDDAESYDRLKEGAPEWLRDLVHEAHGDFLPDDWRYACIRSALAFVHDSESEDASEFADQEVDVYNGARFAWLSSHLQRQGYVDEAVSEFGWNDEGGIAQAIGLGQYMEAHEVFASVLESLQAQLDEIENEDD